ncbi:DDE-type integrase/transposase/recombinase [Bradyrhizobium sp. NBAIM32]|nr:DDE-type integrase/transposase/recombinase [Bradyrhizobium sp. NBAIM32]
MTVDRPNQVRATDITYIPIGRGFLYLVAVIDWASRAVLSWRLSNTMDVSFCIDALEEALARFGFTSGSERARGCNAPRHSPISRVIRMATRPKPECPMDRVLQFPAPPSGAGKPRADDGLASIDFRSNILRRCR